MYSKLLDNPTQRLVGGQCLIQGRQRWLSSAVSWASIIQYQIYCGSMPDAAGIQPWEKVSWALLHSRLLWIEVSMNQHGLCSRKATFPSTLERSSEERILYRCSLGPYFASGKAWSVKGWTMLFRFFGPPWRHSWRVWQKWTASVQAMF